MILDNEFDEWNRAAKAQKPLFSRVRDRVLTYLLRTAMHSCTPHQSVIMFFVFDRTFRWGKYAEAIPRKHFLDGITDQSGALRRGNDLAPVCTGFGPAFKNSSSTFNRHMDELLESGLLERVEASRSFGRSVYSYIFSRALLSEFIILEGGSLPVGATLCRFAPALLGREPVRLVSWEDANGTLLCEVLTDRRTKRWVSVCELSDIDPEYWAELKKSHRWLEEPKDTLLANA